MATNELRGRDNWQTAGGAKAGHAERSFLGVFQEAFRGTEYRINEKPKDFRNVYVNVELLPEVVQEIYNPPGTYSHGFAPDYSIENTATGKTIFIEVKRQDGWVEGKEPSAGRGNAHERSCKFFTPGLLKILRSKGNLGDNILPFWVVFQGDIARDPKRVREVTLWFTGFLDHFFMWRDNTNAAPLLAHFNEKIKPLLGGSKVEKVSISPDGPRPGELL